MQNTKTNRDGRDREEIRTGQKLNPSYRSERDVGGVVGAQTWKLNNRMNRCRAVRTAEMRCRVGQSVR